MVNQIEMKNSGIKWIGQIPKEWGMSRLKYVAQFYNGDRSSNYPSGEDMVDDGICFLTSNNIHGLVVDDTHEISKYITEEKYRSLGGAKIQMNDLVFCLRGSVGNCAINKSLTTGTVASSLVVIRPVDVVPDYLNFTLNSPIAEVQTLDYMNGSCAANLSADNVSRYIFVEPPIEEQKRIVDYLNAICKEVDGLVSDLQAEIDVLEAYKQSLISETVTTGLNKEVELKESRVKWCPLIPKHWERTNPKALFKQRMDRAFRGDKQLTASQEYGIVDQEEFMETTGNRVVTVMKDFSILKHVEPGDFVISMRSFQGGLEYSEKSGCISSAYVMLIPNREKVYPPFYRWFFKSSQYINAIRSTTNLVRDGQAMRYANFVQVPLFLIPIEEQIAIADYLNNQTNEIDLIMQNKREQLETLVEYKKSLIYEYVTGKKEVLQT